MTPLRFGVVAALAVACASAGPRGIGERADLALPAPAVAPPARVILISIHGLTPDRYLGSDPSMPVLAALAQHGIAAESVEPIFAPAPYPAHTSLVTGMAPARHGVPAAFHIDAQGIDPARSYDASDLRAAPLWEVVAQQGGSVASLDWPATQGAPIADLAPDGVVPPGGAWIDTLESRGAGRAAAFARRAGGSDPAAAAPGAARDASLVTMACGLVVAAPAPTFVLLRLSQTQVALDAAGPEAESTRAAFASADAELGRLVRCLGDAGLLETSGLAVAGDHGTLPAHTEIRANAALADAGLLVPAGSGVRSWDAIARSNGGSAFVYASTDEAALLARRALEAVANETRTFRVLSAKDMVERGADPQAWFGVEAGAGYVFADTASAPLLAPASVASAGGYAATDPAMATGFVAWGPGLRSGLRVVGMRETDVAPTLARWLGVRLGVVEGRPMLGWFAPAPAQPVAVPVGTPPDGTSTR